MSVQLLAGEIRNRIKEVRKVRFAEIANHPRNPKKHGEAQRKAFRGSIAELGFVSVPLAYVSERNGGKLTWADGHLRGSEVNGYTGDVAILDIDDAEADKLLLYADPIAAMAEYESQQLDGLLRDISTNDQALQQMLAGMAKEAGLYPDKKQVADPGPQIDKAEELRQKWDVQSGDLWQLGQHRLICGDCTDKVTVERVMGGERAALAWFDPPFGIDLQPQRKKTQAIENDSRVDAQALWSKFLPLLDEYMSPDTNLFLCQDWSEFDWTLPLVRRHFEIKSKIVWNKNVWGIGYYTRPKHEDILYCWKGNPPKPDEPVADVWDVARENAPEHAAEKPPELSAIAIKHFSGTGAIVADWFCGLGGSIIACEQLGRQCRAVEISPAYCAVALERWSLATNTQPVRVEA